MNKEQAKNELITPNLKSDEELIGIIQAVYQPSAWWYFITGPLTGFGMRVYFVAVTTKGLQLHKLTFFGKLDVSNYFLWDEISTLNLKKGMLQSSLKLMFTNGRKLKLNAPFKKDDEKIKEYLLSKSK